MIAWLVCGCSGLLMALVQTLTRGVDSLAGLSVESWRSESEKRPVRLTELFFQRSDLFQGLSIGRQGETVDGVI